MLIQRMDPESYPFDLTNPIKTEDVTYLWCNDGWCYIPELNIRQKFIVMKDSNFLTLIEEPWEGVLPVPLNLEKVARSLFSEATRVWLEKSSYFSELYVEQPAIQSKNKKSRDRQADPQ